MSCDTSNTSLKKRIRRHVIGRTRQYFAVAPPGLESIVHDELKTLFPLSDIGETEPGGVAFQGRLIDCYKANLYLRTAGRILMRVETFNATRFDEFKKKSRNIAWELFIFPGQSLKVHVTTRHCRLHHTAAIAERTVSAVADRLASQRKETPNAAGQTVQEIFIRGEHDRFTLSLNSSGKNLYKRGIKTHRARAPIRETLAAAALLLGGYTGDQPLLDPMCGSGTLSLEGALIATRRPPGSKRHFAFMDWPSFMPLQWRHLLETASADITPTGHSLILASDRDINSIRALKKAVHGLNMADTIHVRQMDFFSFSPSEFTNHPGIVVMNPPYGLRIGSKRKAEQTLEAILDHLGKEYINWTFVLIAPNPDAVEAIPFKKRVLIFPHGGKKRALVIGKIGIN